MKQWNKLSRAQCAGCARQDTELYWHGCASADDETVCICKNCFLLFRLTPDHDMWVTAYCSHQMELAEFIYLEYLRRRQDRLPNESTKTTS